MAWRANVRTVVSGLLALLGPAAVHAQSSPSNFTSAMRYDDDRRVVCQTVRMNAASNFASAPADACTLTPASSAEPDRIMKKLYDSAGRVATIRKAVGTSSEQDYVRYTYTGNSQQATVTDANNNVAAFTYDGLDRRSRWTFPSPTSTGQTNAADYEEYGYDEDGNRTSLRKRDGKTLTYSYDALGRMTVKVVPDGGGLAAGLTRDVYYGYDLKAKVGRPDQVGLRPSPSTGPQRAVEGFRRVLDVLSKLFE